MDSITQAALGAAVGEAVLGRKVGGKAAAWGAALGTLPDLDVLAYPLLDPAQELLFHRGPTHALLFSVLTAPLFGLMLSRLHRKDGVNWKGWWWLAFLALFTHPILDAFTTYGTQLLYPFSRLPVSFSTIFIIDPLYTVPLGVGVVVALFLRRDSPGRRRATAIGLTLSTVYLATTVLNSASIAGVFKNQLESDGVAYTRLEVQPTALNNFLWVGLAVSEDSVHVGLYSRLDADREVTFRPLPKNRQLLPNDDSSNIRTLLWFSRGLYTVEREGDDLYFNDLHVGRSDNWVGGGEPIFRFRLLTDASGNLTGFVQETPSFEARTGVWDRFWARVRGASVWPEESAGQIDSGLQSP